MRIPLALIALMSVAGCHEDSRATSDPDASQNESEPAAPEGGAELAVESLPQLVVLEAESKKAETAAATPAVVAEEAPSWGILEVAPTKAVAQAKPKPKPKPKPAPKPVPRPDPCPGCGMG